MPYSDLWDGLRKAVADGLVYESLGPDGLRLFTYSQSCVYEKRWNEFALLARGLILDEFARCVVATPFPKFFNVGEREGESVPDLPFETFEKVDGSLIIIFHHAGKWQCATKGSFTSDQAKWAVEWMSRYDLSVLNPRATYLAEAVYPENRIVVSYDHSGLVMLGGYHGNGVEMPYLEVLGTACKLGWKVAERQRYHNVSRLLELAKDLPASQEGFVLRFSNGLRLKVKGGEYRRIHRLVSRVTPLAIWEVMMAGDDLGVLRKQLPEEFWTDFDCIANILMGQVEALLAAVGQVAAPLAELSDKEVGLRLPHVPESVRRFIFPYRKSGGDLLSARTRAMVFREIRPVGNRLAGYVPSSAMVRVHEEAA